MSQRNLPARAPRDLIGRILETPDLPRVVQGLEPAVLHQLVQKCGLEDVGPIVAFATTEQLMGVFDHDLWQAARAGAADEFDADRFGLWLEVLVEAGAELAARKVAEMDFDLVTAAFSRYLLVLDAEWNAIERRDAALLDEVLPDLAEQLALAEAALENGLELGGFRIVPRRGAPWDALIEVLSRLSSDQPAFFGKLMVRCGALSTEYIEDNGGLFDVLTSDEQVLSDVAGERDERRAEEGYVGPPEAAAFLKLARQPVGSASSADPLTTRYFRKLDARAATSRKATRPPTPRARAVEPGEAEGRRFLAMLQEEGVLPASQPPLLPAGEKDAPDRLARIRAQLLYAREHDAAAYARRSDELGYLANVLVAGCSFQSRRFRPVEATDAVLAVCNLGLENRPHASGRVLPAGVPGGAGARHRLPVGMERPPRARVSRPGPPAGSCSRRSESRRPAAPARPHAAADPDGGPAEGGDSLARARQAGRAGDPRPAGVGHAARSRRRVPGGAEAFAEELRPTSAARDDGVRVHLGKRPDRVGARFRGFAARPARGLSG